jgi:arylsulfatase A-like enzyme
LAVALGLCAGYLDLLQMLGLKLWWYEEKYFYSGRDFPWTVPLAHAILLAIAGGLVAAINLLRPGLVSLRLGAWLFAVLALWGALLRLPLYSACSLIFAMGAARPISTAIARHGYSRGIGYCCAALLALLGLLAASTSGRRAFNEQRTVAGLPAPRAGARNVVLVVWDTVRASSLSLYGYPRPTSPNLDQWAERGVRYDLALSPAPWTLPSHSSFFTGKWPYQLNSQWKNSLDTQSLTLAEYLRGQGYQTAGFAANTNCCSYETGLDRGFAHYEDYPLTPRSLLGRTIPGRWMLEHVLGYGDPFDRKWARLQSRDARAINDAFFEWVAHSRRDRPFFAYLNYFDAHDPYVPPAATAGRFGIRPAREDYRFLTDLWLWTDKGQMRVRDIVMARDCYDDCVAYLDKQLGRLLGEMRRQKLLDNTVVIITADHGESFGEHLIFGHNTSLYLDEVAVPLVIVGPGVPAGRAVREPVSLRDLPATVVDQLGYGTASPFPGRSLAAFWQAPPAQRTPVLSEIVHPPALDPASARSREAFGMSLVAPGWHYVRDGTGAEQLYDLQNDPLEAVNAIDSEDGRPRIGALRRQLFAALTDSPGSKEVEKAYLGSYRRALQAIVQRQRESTALDSTAQLNRSH